jgi:hypothetical protein
MYAKVISVKALWKVIWDLERIESLEWKGNKNFIDYCVGLDLKLSTTQRRAYSLIKSPSIDYCFRQLLHILWSYPFPVVSMSCFMNTTAIL